ncbi:MAG TPA: DUF2330 domain-containing protein, partial [Myxococcota bacterium]|nr:DUF2330 domain-containing protein [Myxococcota bacterium]
MDLRARSFPCLLMAVVLGQWYAARPANACGGCFTRTDSSSPTVVTGHQMAVALSPARTVLWDQIVYDGAPEDFSWVLPVQGAARLELASDAWFDMLQGTTAVRVSSPPYRCSPGFSGDSGGGGCGSTTGGGSSSSSSGAFSSAPPPVQVVHRET